jgi:hypothetical protein
MKPKPIAMWICFWLAILLAMMAAIKSEHRGLPPQSAESGASKL